MLSIFAVPKPFLGHTAVIQRTAIESWKRIVPSIEVILLGDEEGTRATAKRLGAPHIPILERNDLGTPLLNSIFADGEKAAHRACNDGDVVIPLSVTLKCGRRRRLPHSRGHMDSIF